MGKLSIFLAVLTAASANILLGSPAHLVNTGISTRSQINDGHGNSAMAYTIKDASSVRSKSEVRNVMAVPVLGHGIAAPIMAQGIIAAPMGIAAPVALGVVIGNAGLGLGIGNGLGLGLGNGLGLGIGGMGLGMKGIY